MERKQWKKKKEIKRGETQEKKENISRKKAKYKKIRTQKEGKSK